MTNDIDRLPMGAEGLLLDTNKRQDNLHWLEMWRENHTQGFHQAAVNPLLMQFWHLQKLKKKSRILVPLCGKSLDMLWLAKQGFSVVGVEISPVAVKAFFRENHLKVKKQRHGNFTCWRSEAITIWCGDFFSLHKDQLGHIDSVFDRAALTALPELVREQYVAQLRCMIDVEAGVFLMTVEDIAKNSELAITHIDNEIVSLYKEYFEIKLVHVQEIVQQGAIPPVDASTLNYDAYNKVYQLTPH